MSNEEQMRAEFEAWCDANLFPQSWKDDNGAWKMWQVKQQEIYTKDALSVQVEKMREALLAQSR